MATRAVTGNKSWKQLRTKRLLKTYRPGSERQEQERQEQERLEQGRNLKKQERLERENKHMNLLLEEIERERERERERDGIKGECSCFSPVNAYRPH